MATLAHVDMSKKSNIERVDPRRCCFCDRTIAVNHRFVMMDRHLEDSKGSAHQTCFIRFMRRKKRSTTAKKCR